MKQAIIFTIISLTGCHPLFCTWDFGYVQLNIQPAKEQLIGKYELSEASVTFLKNRKFKADEYSLTLADNGQFQFENGPDLIFNSWGKSEQKLIDRKGKWHVSCGDSYDCLIELEGVSVVPLTEKDGRLAILITVGDGDECNGIVYRKVKD